MLDATWTITPCDPREAAALARALGVSETTASVLVRRGYDDPASGGCVPRRRDARARPVPARRHAGGVRPDPRRDRRPARRICVHGDYDVDGICATALAVLVLRELGADVEWHLPSRFEEGYGVAGETLARLAAEGCGLVLTVDCGITAVDEVAAREGRRARGDRHRPPPARRRAARLPDRRHPPVRLSVPGALRHRRRLQARARRCSGPTSRALARHLDLVALATIADVVPLVDENRALALAGLRRLATTTQARACGR